MHAAAAASRRILQRQVRPRTQRVARGSAGRLDGGGSGSGAAAPRGVWEQAHHLRGGDPDDEQVQAEAVWQGGGGGGGAEHSRRHGVDRGASVERRALDEALGEVTDALDALEHGVAAGGVEEEGRWEERLAEAAALFQAFLHRHAAARAATNPLDQPAFDYWFRPRVAETKNWFNVVCARRSERVVAAAAAAATAGPASVPATTTADFSDPASAPPPALSGDEAARLEARAAEDVASLDGVDVYRLWRARGRPCAAHGGTEGLLDLPGYTPRHRQRRGDEQRAVEAEVDRKLAARYGFDASNL